MSELLNKLLSLDAVVLLSLCVCALVAFAIWGAIKLVIRSTQTDIITSMYAELRESEKELRELAAAQSIIIQSLRQEIGQLRTTVDSLASKLDILIYKGNITSEDLQALQAALKPTIKTKRQD